MSQYPGLVLVWLWIAYGLARAGRAVGLRPNVVTAFRLALSVIVVVMAAWRGTFLVLAAVLVLISSVADVVDGALAMMTGTGSRIGQVYDALADRLSEACWLVAFAVLGASAWLVAACGALMWIHDDLRTKALGAGMVNVPIITVGERPTRILVVASTLLLAGLGDAVSPDLPVGIVTAASAAWAMLQAAALLQLFGAVRCALR
ncbi:MAG: CDP-alcohol phosphatidyltransferase family protein [Micromonosporaceae bacterium]|nr:CDP-alcohol phosphatidyltransferase family protein [Micromonosporaceae bacterium]